MSDSEDSKPDCPVCAVHTEEDALASQQVALMGVKAMFERDGQMVQDVFDSMTPYDGHVAIFMFALALGDISMMTGIPVEAIIARYQENLTSAQTLEAAAAPETPDSGSPGRHRRED